ncbi:MAG TPA: alcohol dehydrogenase catalytic domain-containing protein [Gaiellaceae bacterium]|nr:alcohol dehydrogenase catalytic domain-containing protein [Gaiellaceae bacterium]
MRAAVLREIYGPLSVDDVELAEPGAGEVAVRLAASGVCHSDWNVITGATPNPLPAVLGHEGAGVVEQVGNGVTRVGAGHHVVLSWLPSCGTLFFCVQGRRVLCDVAMADMFEGTLPGGSLALSQGGTPSTTTPSSPPSPSAASSRRPAACRSGGTRRSRWPRSSAAR